MRIPKPIRKLIRPLPPQYLKWWYQWAKPQYPRRNKYQRLMSVERLDAENYPPRT